MRLPVITRSLIWLGLFFPVVVSCQFTARTSDGIKQKEHAAGDVSGCQISGESMAITDAERGESPIIYFLKAEGHLRSEERCKAENAYWNTLQSAGDKSSIAGFALWRLLEEFGPTDADYIFKTADAILYHNSLTRRLFEVDDVQFTGTSLTDFPADIWATLSELAWDKDMRLRSALYGYLAGFNGSLGHIGALQNWMEEQRDAVMTEEETTLVKLYLGAAEDEDIAKVRDYWLKGDRRELRRASHLRHLRLFRQAVDPLASALSSRDVEVRLRAYIDLSRIGRNIALTLGDRLRIIDLGREDDDWDTAPKKLRQEALIERGRILDAQGKLEGAIESYEMATEPDLSSQENCWGESDDGDIAHQAIYLIARRYEQEAISVQDEDTKKAYFERARTQYENLRNHCGGEHPRAESAYFRAALMEYGQEQAGRASKILEALVALNPYPSKGKRENSVIYSAALFWLARIYSEQGRGEESAEKISDLISIAGSLSYYGIRAMMLQNSKEPSFSKIYPDEKTERMLSAKYSASRSARSQEICADENGQSRSQKIVCSALRSGVYRQARQTAMDAWTAGTLVIGRSDPYYIVDFMGTLGPLAVWRSIRSDVLNEVALMTPDHCLYFARKFADIGDWNTSIMIMHRSGVLGGYAGHLAGAFPPAYAEAIRDAVRDPDSGSVDFQLAEFIYAVMRQESMFSETALSRDGAFGLFQFIERTYRSKEVLHEVRRISSERVSGSKDDVVERRETFLADPSRAIRLASVWLGKLRDGREGGVNLVLAAMEHNAGKPAVDRWFYRKKQRGFLLTPYSKDVEWLVEMAWSPQTRIFTREVLTNLAMARAARIFPEF